MKKGVFIALAAAIMLLGHSLPGQAHVRGSIWVGPVWGPAWGPAWGPGYWAPPPTVVIRQEPRQYLEAAPLEAAPQPEQYWYYCPDPKGYYPYVEKCPKGWMKVAPTPAPPEPEEE